MNCQVERPIISSASHPSRRASDGLWYVITPSGSRMQVMSCEFSMSARKCSSLWRSTSAMRTRSVMSTL